MSLGEAWRKSVELHEKAAAGLEAHNDRVWAEEIISRIPEAVRAAMGKGASQVEIGTFMSKDIPPQRGEFFPKPGDPVAARSSSSIVSARV